jgi:outer membrane protein assembly factor BamB
MIIVTHFYIFSFIQHFKNLIESIYNLGGNILKIALSALSIFVIALVSSGLSQNTNNWPHWRGPDHNGIINDVDLPTSWSTTGNIKWKTKLPWWGASTPIIWEDKIFIVSPSEDEGEDLENHNPGGSELLLLSVSKTDGKILWQKELDDHNEMHRKANDASPSPVTDGTHVWVVTGTGLVIAFDMDGNKKWQRDLQDEYGSFSLNWGYASSPVLYKKSLIIEVLHSPDNDDPSYLISIDALTGKTQWFEERKTDAHSESPDAYSTPLILDHAGEMQIVIVGGDYVTGHNIATGKEIWRAGGLNPRNRGNYRIVGSPVTADGIIYAPTRKRPLLALKAGGIGDITESHLLWKWEDDGGPDVPSTLSDGKYFYMVDDKSKITCLDAKSGKLIWGPTKTTGGIVSASPILSDGKIYILNEQGKTAIVAAGNEFKQLNLNELDGSYTLSSPAVSGSNLFIRTGMFLYCIGK